MASLVDELGAGLAALKVLKAVADSGFTGAETWVANWGAKIGLSTMDIQSTEATLKAAQGLTDSALLKAETVVQALIALLGMFGPLSLVDLENVLSTHPVLTTHPPTAAPKP